MASGKSVPEWARGKYCPFHIEQAGIQAYGVQTQVVSPEQQYYTPQQHSHNPYGFDQQYDRQSDRR